MALIIGTGDGEVLVGTNLADEIHGKGSGDEILGNDEMTGSSAKTDKT